MSTVRGLNPSRARRAALSGLAGACGLFSLLQLGVATLLPQIQHAFGVSGTDASWIVSGHLLVGCVATPVVGRLGDLYGRRVLLFWVLAVVALASVAATLAQTFAVLLVARLVQGVAAGIFPLAIGLLREGFPDQPLAGPSGVLSAAFGTGGGVGILLVGLFGDGAAAFRWLFATAGVLAVVLLAMGALVLPETPRRTGTRVDVPGLLLLSAVSACLLLALTRYGQEGLGSVTAAVLLAAGVVGCAALVRVERRSPQPAIDTRLLGRRPIWTLNAVSLLTGLVMFQNGVLAPALADAPRSTGYGLAADGGTTVLVMLPMQITALTGGLLSGWVRQSGWMTARALMITSTALFAVSPVVFALQSGTVAGLALGTALTGLATGLLGGAVAELLTLVSPSGTTAVTVGINSVLRNLGGSFGVQVGSMILAVATPAAGYPAAGAYTTVFVGSAVLCAAGVAAALAFPKPAEHPGQEMPSASGRATHPIRPTT
ncbi:MFS transporter [Streptomyces sulfonofaciens]|uniref:MFS transporter n=1 Tax=Streptomyces sulfonofaciens TaxID=68272 RepID=A0A919GAE1_9ACTN|nr:MFS transporter [Streptomyces sulfonofaciens]GHH81142.1 MFS transporter [Streptomyces sulfonofaciens]